MLLGCQVSSQSLSLVFLLPPLPPSFHSIKSKIDLALQQTIKGIKTYPQMTPMGVIRVPEET